MTSHSPSLALLAYDDADAARALSATKLRSGPMPT